MWSEHQVQAEKQSVLVKAPIRVTALWYAVVSLCG